MLQEKSKEKVFEHSWIIVSNEVDTYYLLLGY